MSGAYHDDLLIKISAFPRRACWWNMGRSENAGAETLGSNFALPQSERRSSVPTLTTLGLYLISRSRLHHESFEVAPTECYSHVTANM